MSEEINDKTHALACAEIWVAECKVELEAAQTEQTTNCQKMRAERMRLEAEHAQTEAKMAADVRRRQLALERAVQSLALASANKDRGFEV